VSLFAGFTPVELRRVAGLARRQDVAAGTVLCQQGDPGHEFFVVRDGRVRVDRDGQPVAVLGAGDWFGELALLDRAPRSATVTATEATTVLVIGEADFTVLIDEVPALAHHLLAHLASRLRQAEAGH